MIPTRRFFLLLWLVALLGIAVGYYPEYWSLWAWTWVGLIGLVLVDGLHLVSIPALSCHRFVSHSLSVGIWNNVDLEVHNSGFLKVNIDFFDHHPESFESAGIPVMLKVPARGWIKHHYYARPTKRGDFSFSHIQFRLYGKLGLLKRNRNYQLEHPVRVYPNISHIVKYNLLAQEQRQQAMGIRRYRRRGVGMEFQQLREYRDGDSLRQVDWKATARIRKLISREYQDEKDQRVVVLLDCGRRMLSRDSDLSHFDHSLNASLLLSLVALRQGDAVGLMTFSGTERWLAPKKGAHRVNLVLNTVYDLEPSLQESDFMACALKVMHLLPKRSLLILITNLRDEDPGELIPALALLRRRHLVLLVSLRDQIIDDQLTSLPTNFEQCLERAAIYNYLDYRDELKDQLQRQRVLTLDASPKQLGVAVVNKYLEIKSAGYL